MFPLGQRVFSRSSITGEEREYFVPPTISEYVASFRAEKSPQLSCGKHSAPLAAIVAARGRVMLSSDLLTHARSIQRLANSWCNSTLDSDTLLHLHAQLSDRRNIRSTYRDSMVWVDGLRPTDAKFIPSPASSVAPLLDDYFAFLRRDDIPALEKMAIAHYQFLAIHPFFDGNGRLSRILALLTAARSNGPGVAFAIAAGLSLHRRASAKLFVQVRCGELGEYLEDWRKLFAWSGRCVQELHELRVASKKRLVAQLHKSNASDRALTFLLGNPLFTTRDLIESLSLSAKLASHYPNTMLSSGIIEKLPSRDTESFCCPIVVDYWRCAQQFVAATAVDVLPP
jgi:Fic family protein